MEPIIIVFWFLLIPIIPLFLIVAVFVELRGARDFNRIGIAVLALFVHILAVCLTFFPMFVVVYAGAHTKPAGQALDFASRLFVCSIEILYTVLFFSISSYIAGRERPWPFKVSSLS